ncbi:hypothetical protein H0H93_011080 [Arthromyces matolae]|nr:hypothetical protein H0H93_011080 [Arthromyces matolae]
MTRCWHKSPLRRPPLAEVVKVLESAAPEDTRLRDTMFFNELSPSKFRRQMSVGLDIIDVETLDVILGRNNANSATNDERNDSSDIIKSDPDFAITISLLQMVDAQVLDQNIRRRLIVAMQRLAADSNIFPTCYSLDDVETNGDFPVAVGSYADIYKGTFQGQVVCIKIPRVFRESEIQGAITNAAQEIILWGQLSHPNIVPFIGFFFHKDLPGRIALVSQWMENDNVNEYLKRNPDAVRLLLALDIVRGLEYLHNDGVVHGCLKGAEILVDKSGRAQISDVGVSSTLDAHMLTSESRYKGAANLNVRWLAPELLDVDGEGEPERTQKTLKSILDRLGFDRRNVVAHHQVLGSTTCFAAHIE